MCAFFSSHGKRIILVSQACDPDFLFTGKLKYNQYINLYEEGKFKRKIETEKNGHFNTKSTYIITHT